MTRPRNYRLTDAERDALLDRQARLIDRQAVQIEGNRPLEAAFFRCG